MDSDGAGSSSMALALRSHQGMGNDGSTSTGTGNASNAFIDNSNPLNFQLTTLPPLPGGPAKAAAAASSSTRSGKGKGKGTDTTALTAAAAPAGSRSASTPNPAIPSNPSTRNIPAFLNKLFSMVNDPATDPLIRWTESGSSFIVPSAERFGKELLPRFFKHSNFGSFVRQLNMYGFHKVPHLQQGVLKLEDEEEKERAEVLEFRSDNFQRGQPDLLYLIQRKKGNGGNFAAGASLGPGGEPEDGAGAGGGDGTDSTSGHGTGAVASGSGASNSVAASNQHALIKFQGELSQILAEVQAIKRHQTILSSELRDLQGSNRTLWQDNFEEKVKNDKNAEMIDKILKFLAGVFGGRALNGNNGGTDAPTGGAGAAHVSGNGNGSNIASVSVDGDEHGDGDDGLSPAERNVAMADSISGLGLGNYNNGGWQTYVNNVAGQQRQEAGQASHQQGWEGQKQAARPGVVRRGASGYEVVKAVPRKRQRLMIEGSSPDKAQRDVSVPQPAAGSSGRNKRKEMMPDIMDVESPAAASARPGTTSQFEELHSDDELPTIGRVRGGTAATSSTTGTDSPAASPPANSTASRYGERRWQSKQGEVRSSQRAPQGIAANTATTAWPAQSESTTAGQPQMQPAASDQQLQLWQQLQDQQQGAQSTNGIDWSSVSSILNGTRGDAPGAGSPTSFDFNDPAFLASLSAYATTQPGGAGATSLVPPAVSLPYDPGSAPGASYSNPSAYSLALSPSNPNNSLAQTPFQNGVGPNPNTEQALTKYNNTLTNVSDENVKLKERMDSLSGAIDRLVAQLPEGFQWDQSALAGASAGTPQTSSILAQGNASNAVPSGSFDDDDFDFEQYLQNANASAFMPPPEDTLPPVNEFSLGDTSMDPLGGIGMGDSSLYSQADDPLAAYLSADHVLSADDFGLMPAEQPSLDTVQPGEASPAVKEESPVSQVLSPKTGAAFEVRPSTRKGKGASDNGSVSVLEKGGSNVPAGEPAALDSDLAETPRRTTRARSKR